MQDGPQQELLIAKIAKECRKGRKEKLGLLREL
jgi:hypothetical protein